MQLDLALDICRIYKYKYKSKLDTAAVKIKFCFDITFSKYHNSQNNNKITLLRKYTTQ